MPRPKTQKDVLAIVIPFRLSETEVLTFREKVARSGMSQSEFLRECVLTNRTTVIAKPNMSLEKRRMQFIVNKAGNNINQLARYLNTANLDGKLADALYMDGLENLASIAKYLRSALNHVD